MQISAKRLDEFIALYRAEYGVCLSREDAREAGEFIVRIVRAVDCQPVPPRPAYNESEHYASIQR